MRATNSVRFIKNVGVKANKKPWFHIEMISATQKKNKLFLKYENSILKTFKDKFKSFKKPLPEILNRKKCLFRGKICLKLKKHK